MKHIKILSIFFLCMICFSCATKNISKVYIDIEGNPDLIGKITVEIADLINQEKNINTTINLVYDFDNVLGNEVLKELKKRGFPLSDTNGVRTTVIVGSHDFHKIHLTISLDKMILSRIYIYEVQTGTITPITPLSKGRV